MNADFDKLTEPRKEAVLRVVEKARIEGYGHEFLPMGEMASATKQSSDGKIEWRIIYYTSSSGALPE